MNTKITFTSELLSNFTNLIFITKLGNHSSQHDWEILTDKDGNTFDRLTEAIEFIRTETSNEWGIGLSTFKGAMTDNAEWDNL